MNDRSGGTPFHIPSLDGIRATAFLLVFLGHSGVPGIPGGFGVTVFFFLSGYLITTLLRLEIEKRGRINFKQFYLRRALRILPPFYLVLLAAVAMTQLHLLPGVLHWPAVAAQALHYSNYWVAFRGFQGIPLGTGVYWSLAVEEHFYALLPALYALLVGAKVPPRTQRSVFFAICALTLVWRCVLVFYFDAPTDRTYVTTDARCDSLLMGCALAVAGNPMLDSEPGSARAPSTRLLAALAGGLGLLLVSFLIRNDGFRETARYTLQGVGLYAVFYCAIRFPYWGPFRFLQLRFMGFLGKLSYSLYLVHQVVIALLIGWLPTGLLVRGVLSFGGSLLIAWLIWTSVEKPALRMRRRLEVTKTIAPAATAARQA